MIVLAAPFFYRYKYSICVAFLLIAVTSCTIVKDHPAVPFVYETDIQIDAPLETDQKKDLISQLNNQLHDSIRVRKVQKILGWEKRRGPRMFYSVLEKPAVYDSM